MTSRTAEQTPLQQNTVILPNNTSFVVEIVVRDTARGDGTGKVHLLVGFAALGVLLFADELVADLGILDPDQLKVSAGITGVFCHHGNVLLRGHRPQPPSNFLLRILHIYEGYK